VVVGVWIHGALQHGPVCLGVGVSDVASRAMAAESGRDGPARFE
jgi:hypothetical protein